MKLNIGDRVRLLVDHPSHNPDLYIGDLGTICYINDDNVGVRWDYAIDHGHDCYGYCEYDYGWLVYEKELELVCEIQTEPQTEFDFLQMIS